MICQCGSISPIHVSHAYGQTISLRNVLPTLGKRSTDNDQNLITRGCEVDYRGLHRPGARSSKKHRHRIGFQTGDGNPLQTFPEGPALDVTGGKTTAVSGNTDMVRDLHGAGQKQTTVFLSKLETSNEDSRS